MARLRSMHVPGFIVRIYHFASPAHRRAARERRKEYETNFEQHKEENLKRVRRMSQLRGDQDVADFLFDSAHGTGAAYRSRSMQDIPSLPTSYPPRPSANGRPFSMIYDGSAPMHSYYSPSYGRRSTSVHTTSDRRPSSVTVPSLRTASTSLSGGSSLDVSLPVVQPLDAPVSAVQRPSRPVSMPPPLARQRSKLRRRNVDWWGQPEPSPQEMDEFMRVGGPMGGPRQLTMAAHVA